MNINLHTDPDFCGSYWSLVPSEDLKFEELLNKIKRFEFEANVKRVKGPHIKTCSEEKAIGKRGDMHFCFVEDQWQDIIEVAANYIIKAHHELPMTISTVNICY